MPSGIIEGTDGGIEGVEGADPNPISFESNRDSYALHQTRPRGTFVPLDYICQIDAADELCVAGGTLRTCGTAWLC